MLVFEFRDMTPIEAFVLAQDDERAAEMFQSHLQAHGGDPDTLMWRERSVDYLGEVEGRVISEALAIDREGLVSCDASGRWVFVTALGMA